MNTEGFVVAMSWPQWSLSSASTAWPQTAVIPTGVPPVAAPVPAPVAGSAAASAYTPEQWATMQQQNWQQWIQWQQQYQQWQQQYGEQVSTKLFLLLTNSARVCVSFRTEIFKLYLFFKPSLS